MNNLNREALIKALRVVGELALEQGLELEICIYGGSAMLLAYDSRNATKDVDAVLNPSEAGKKLAASAARRLDLHDDWLNDDVKQFLGPDPRAGRRALDLGIPGLKVYVATAGYLLAMKTIACRRPLPGYRGDQDDLLFLIRKIGIRSVDEIQERLDRFFPDAVIDPRNIETLEALIAEASNE